MGAELPAHVQACQLRMCSVNADAFWGYSAGVQPEQQIIAEWIRQTAAKHDLSLGAWARKAGIKAETTVTRAVKEDYPSVTTVRTLDQLARAVGEPSPLDFLQGRTAQQDNAPAVPSEEALATLLAAVLPLVPRGRTSAQSTRVAAAALQRGLELLGDQTSSKDPAALGVAARGAIARLRDLLQQ